MTEVRRQNTKTLSRVRRVPPADIAELVLDSDTGGRLFEEDPVDMVLVGSSSPRQLLASFGAPLVATAATLVATTARTIEPPA